jgi:hypothetical protein
MTLGCGSWGGNVTSDNVGPLHLMDIKRVAFETRAVKSVRPAAGTATRVSSQAENLPEPAIAGGKINRQEIAAIVDRFLAGKGAEAKSTSPLPPPIVSEPGSMYSAPPQNPEPKVIVPLGSERSPDPLPKPVATANGSKPVDFVSEDDVRRAIQKGEKIYITPKTIITPAARDLGEPTEVFAKI